MHSSAVSNNFKYNNKQQIKVPVLPFPAKQWIATTFLESSSKNFLTSSQKGLIKLRGGASWSLKG